MSLERSNSRGIQNAYYLQEQLLCSKYGRKNNLKEFESWRKLISLSSLDSSLFKRSTKLGSRQTWEEHSIQGWMIHLNITGVTTRKKSFCNQNKTFIILEVTLVTVVIWGLKIIVIYLSPRMFMEFTILASIRRF